MTSLSLDKPMNIRAEMARRGLMPRQLLAYDDPERGWVDPIRDTETKAAVLQFLGQLWDACVQAEAPR